MRTGCDSKLPAALFHERLEHSIGAILVELDADFRPEVVREIIQLPACGDRHKECLRHGPAEVIEKLERGEVVDPDRYYFRINPMFETAAPQYDWINRVIAVGVGHSLADGPVYSVFEVL